MYIINVYCFIPPPPPFFRLFLFVGSRSSPVFLLDLHFFCFICTACCEFSINSPALVFSISFLECNVLSLHCSGQGNLSLCSGYFSSLFCTIALTSLKVLESLRTSLSSEIILAAMVDASILYMM